MNDWVVEVKDFEEEILEGLYTLLNENGINKVKDLINLKNKQIDQLTNNWNELEDIVDNEVNYYFEDEDAEWFEAKKIQNIMKEIKENN